MAIRILQKFKKIESKNNQKIEIAQQGKEAAGVAAAADVSDNVPIAPAYVEPSREDKDKADVVNGHIHVQKERHSDSSGSNTSSTCSGCSSSSNPSIVCQVSSLLHTPEKY